MSASTPSRSNAMRNGLFSPSCVGRIQPCAEAVKIVAPTSGSTRGMQVNRLSQLVLDVREPQWWWRRANRREGHFWALPQSRFRRSEILHLSGAVSRKMPYGLAVNDRVQRRRQTGIGDPAKKESMISWSASSDSARLMAVRKEDPFSSPFVYHDPSARTLLITHRS
jgi:hypothetical protein